MKLKVARRCQGYWCADKPDSLAVREYGEWLPVCQKCWMTMMKLRYGSDDDSTDEDSEPE